MTYLWGAEMASWPIVRDVIILLNAVALTWYSVTHPPTESWVPILITALYASPVALRADKLFRKDDDQ